MYVHLGFAFIAYGSYYDASGACQLVNELVERRSAVMRTHVGAETHVYDTRFVDFISVFKDILYGVGHIRTVCAETYKYDLGIRCYA